FRCSGESRQTTPQLLDWLFGRCRLMSASELWLKDNVEIKSQPASMTSEEETISRIVDVGMHLKRVEMICNVESADRKSQRILVIDFEILRHARIQGQEIREASLIGNTDIVLQHVRRCVRKSVSPLDHRRNPHLPGQPHYAPGKKAIWQIARQVGECIWPHNRKRKI